MIAGIMAEVIKCLKYKKNHRILAIVALVPPLAISIFFIEAFSFGGGGGFPMVVVNYDNANVDGWTDNFITTLGSQEGTIPYFEVTVTDEEDALRMFDLRETFLVVYIPQDFSTNLTSSQPVLIRSLINNIHEDLSKNLRLGMETRIYEFSVNYQLQTGVKPGLEIDKSTVYLEELPRPDYMISGIIVFSIMFFALLDGALLGSSEKEEGTDIEIKMAKNGIMQAKLGKVLATIIASGINTIILLIFSYLMYGPYFTGFTSFLVFLAVFLCISFVFAVIGVNYGMKVGDIRAVPGPSVLITVVLWMVGGAINPLEFSAGSPIFKFLPNAASVRILTAAIFERGNEYVVEGWTILLGWASLMFMITLAQIIRTRKK